MQTASLASKAQARAFHRAAACTPSRNVGIAGSRLDGTASPRRCLVWRPQAAPGAQRVRRPLPRGLSLHCCTPALLRLADFSSVASVAPQASLRNIDWPTAVLFDCDGVSLLQLTHAPPNQPQTIHPDHSLGCPAGPAWPAPVLVASCWTRLAGACACGALLGEPGWRLCLCRCWWTQRQRATAWPSMRPSSARVWAMSGAWTSTASCSRSGVGRSAWMRTLAPVLTGGAASWEWAV